MSTVFVASKLPMDLELYVGMAQEYFDPLSNGGSVTRTRMVPSGEPITIRGTGYPILPTPVFQAWKPPPQKVSGYALPSTSTAHAGQRYPLGLGRLAELSGM
jgi:hypothetical protein